MKSASPGSRNNVLVPPPVRVIPGLGALAARYDGFILDLWGVVHDGVAPLPGAPQCLARLKAAGKRLVLLSNAPRRAEDVAERIARIGIPRTLYDAVFSSGEEAWQCLRGRGEPFYAQLGRRCLHIGSERDMGMRDGLALDFVAEPEEADFVLNTGPAGWHDRIEDYEGLLRRALRCELPMVCANPDLVVMHGGALTLCAGALAERYEAWGGVVRWHGKPYRSVYETSIRLLGVAERSRILAVGDSVRTDIAGAEGAEIPSLLIAGGIHAREFGAEGEGPLDLQAIAAALDSRRPDRARGGPFQPIGVARRFCW
jgi:HAD superfamily hydrolase (TIGR01459 family)